MIPAKPRLLTKEEAAERIGVSVLRLMEYVHSGRLPFTNIGLGQVRIAYRFDLRDLDAFAPLLERGFTKPKTKEDQRLRMLEDLRELQRPSSGDTWSTRKSLLRHLLGRPISDRDPEPRSGFVYVCGFGPYVKIGFSITVGSRLETLQIGAPEEIIVYRVIPALDREERDYHRRFASLRLKGEWFRKEAELAEWIAGGCK